MAKVSIYGLKDPTDGQIHYIGKSVRPETRYKEHLTDTDTNLGKAAWISGLQGQGLEPELVVLEKVRGKDWPDAERKWIAEGRKKHWPLTNIADGGPGWGGQGEEPYYMALRPFLPSGYWAQFLMLPDDEKWAIVRATCLSIAEYSFVGCTALSLDDRRWYTPGLAGTVGAEVARALLDAQAEQSPVGLSFMLKCIDNSADLLSDRVELVTQRR